MLSETGVINIFSPKIYIQIIISFHRFKQSTNECKLDHHDRHNVTVQIVIIKVFPHYLYRSFFKLSNPELKLILNLR